MSVRAIALGATLFAGVLVPLAASTAASAGPASPPRSLCAPPTDTVGPVATSVTFGQSSIDLDSGSRVQTVTVDASDTSGDGAPSGVAHVQIQIQGKDFYSGASLKLTSGTSTSGTWTGTFTVSKYAHAGIDRITGLYVLDAAGNQQQYDGYDRDPDGPNALSLHPALDPTFTVTGTPATRPPGKPTGTLTGFTSSASTANTVTSTQRVHFTATFAGAAPREVAVGVNSSKSTKQTKYVFLNGRLHHHQHGLWSGAVTVPRWLGKQTLNLQLHADWGRHYRPSARYYGSQQLHKLHFPSTLAVVSGVDHTKPKLTSLSLSPDPINSTTGSERVTVTATATDTGSGVRSVFVDGNIRNGINGVAAGAYPYRASGIGYLSSQDLRVRLKKNAAGDWVGSTTVRQCVPSGTYKLTADLQDVAGNYTFDSTKQLAKAGITSTVAVTSKHGDVEPPYVYSAATYSADHELFLNFSEGVKQVSTSTLTVFPLSPKSSRYTATSPVASIVCSNGTNAVDCSGSAGVITSAVLTIPGLTSGTKYEVWANLNQVTTQLTDGNGNPLDWNYAATEVIGA